MKYKNKLWKGALMGLIVSSVANLITLRTLEPTNVFVSVILSMGIYYWLHIR